MGTFVAQKVWQESHWSPDSSGGVTAMAFSADHRVLVSAVGFDINGVDTVWDVSDPARPRRLTTRVIQGPAPPHWYGYPSDIVFSPDGRTLALTTSRNRVALWNVASPAHAVRVATLGGHTGPVAAIAFSPGGHLLADVGYDGAVTVFDITDPARPDRTADVRTIAGGRMPDGSLDYSGTKYALAFSADGHTLTVIADSAASVPGPWSAPARQSTSRWSLTDAGAAAPAAAVSDGTAPAACRLPYRACPTRSRPGRVPRAAAR